MLDLQYYPALMYKNREFNNTCPNQLSCGLIPIYIHVITNTIISPCTKTYNFVTPNKIASHMESSITKESLRFLDVFSEESVDK